MNGDDRAAPLTALTFGWPLATAVAGVSLAELAAFGGVAALGSYLGIEVPQRWLLFGFIGIVYVSGVLVVRAFAGRAGVPFAEAVGLRRPPRGALAVAVLAAFGSVALGLAVSALLQALGVPAPGTDVVSMFGSDAGGLLLAYLVAGVIAPFAEEVLFRGALLARLLARWGAPAAIAVSAVLFGIVHWSAYATPVAMLVGAVFGWLFVTRRSLWVPIAAHAFYNLILVSIARVAGN